MRTLTILACLFACSGPTSALAQSCESWVGQEAELATFDTVVEQLRTAPLERGEYETTAEFEQRQSRSAASIPDRIVIQGIFDPKHVTYDADAASLRVSAFALRNLNTDYSRVFGFGTAFDGKVDYGAYSNVDVVVFQSETATGTYTASNAYGAYRTVTEITRVQKAIFDREAVGFSDEPFVSQAKGSDANIGTVPMSVPETKAIKATGKVAYVASPKWPYYATGIKTWDPTISRPTDVTNHIEVIVADLQCALLLSANNFVIAAFEMD